MRLLEGFRVLDFGRFIAGPYCAALLGDHGADVIRIERVQGGEDRYLPPVADTGEGGMYLQNNRNKRCLTLDLASPEGRTIVQQLVRTADVVVANLPPTTLRQLGLDYPTLSTLNPRVVLVVATAYGPVGPASAQAGFDSVGQAMSGAMYMSGQPGAPARTCVNYVDFHTAQACAMGAIAALWARERTGRGQLVEGSLLRSALIHSNGMLIEQAVRAPNRFPQGNR
ncbi:MAG: CoA transferase, partial [Rhodoferax sp.]|nr:CoA transferase [Rhodoferax sp.]